MICYECSLAGRNREAVGLCHHCSSALCADHACVVTDPVMTMRPVFKTVVLPKKARQLLCGTCLDALQQVGTQGLEAGKSKEYCTPTFA
jgi:hypothetical protein